MDTDDPPGLVIHVSSGVEEDLRTALRYAVNFTAACAEPRRVDVVVNGPALDLVLAESVLRGQVSALHDTGSVLHLAQRQCAGWAYLRP